MLSELSEAQQNILLKRDNFVNNKLGAILPQHDKDYNKCRSLLVRIQETEKAIINSAAIPNSVEEINTEIRRISDVSDFIVRTVCEKPGKCCKKHEKAATKFGFILLYLYSQHNTNTSLLDLENEEDFTETLQTFEDALILNTAASDRDDGSYNYQCVSFVNFIVGAIEENCHNAYLLKYASDLLYPMIRQGLNVMKQVHDNSKTPEDAKVELNQLVRAVRDQTKPSVICSTLINKIAAATDANAPNDRRTYCQALLDLYLNPSNRAEIQQTLQELLRSEQQRALAVGEDAAVSGPIFTSLFCILRNTAAIVSAQSAQSAQPAYTEAGLALTQMIVDFLKTDARCDVNRLTQEDLMTTVAETVSQNNAASMGTVYRQILDLYATKFSGAQWTDQVINKYLRRDNTDRNPTPNILAYPEACAKLIGHSFQIHHNAADTAVLVDIYGALPSDATYAKLLCAACLYQRGSLSEPQGYAQQLAAMGTDIASITSPENSSLLNNLTTVSSMVEVLLELADEQYNAGPVDQPTNTDTIIRLIVAAYAEAKHRPMYKALFLLSSVLDRKHAQQWTHFMMKPINQDKMVPVSHIATQQTAGGAPQSAAVVASLNQLYQDLVDYRNICTELLPIYNSLSYDNSYNKIINDRTINQTLFTAQRQLAELRERISYNYAILPKIDELKLKNCPLLAKAKNLLWSLKDKQLFNDPTALYYDERTHIICENSIAQLEGFDYQLQSLGQLLAKDQAALKAEQQRIATPIADAATDSAALLAQLPTQIDQDYATAVVHNTINFMAGMRALQQQQGPLESAQQEEDEVQIVSLQEEEQQEEQEQEQEEEQQERLCQQDVANYNRLQNRSPARFGASFGLGSINMALEAESNFGRIVNSAVPNNREKHIRKALDKFDIRELLTVLYTTCPNTQLDSAPEPNAEQQDPPELTNLIGLLNKIKAKIEPFLDDTAATRLIEQIRAQLPHSAEPNSASACRDLGSAFARTILTPIRKAFQQTFNITAEQFNQRPLTLSAMIQALLHPDQANALLHGDSLPAGFLIKRRTDGCLIISYDEQAAKIARQHQTESVQKRFGCEYLQYLGTEVWQHDDRPVNNPFLPSVAEGDPIPAALQHCVALLESDTNHDWLCNQLGCADAAALLQHFQRPDATDAANQQLQAIEQFIKVLRILSVTAPAVFQLFKRQYLDQNANWDRFLDSAHLQALMAVRQWGQDKQAFFANRVDRHLTQVGPYNFAALVSQFQCFVTRMQDIYDCTDKGEFYLDASSPLLTDPQQPNFIQGINAAAWIVETAQRPEDMLHRLLDRATSHNLTKGFHQQFMRDPSLQREQVLMRAGQSDQRDDLLTLSGNSTNALSNSSQNVDHSLSDLYSQALRLQYFPSQTVMDAFERKGRALYEDDHCPFQANRAKWQRLLDKLDEYMNQTNYPNTFLWFKNWLNPTAQDEYIREFNILHVDGLSNNSDLAQVRQEIQRKLQAVPRLMRQLALNSGLTPKVAAQFLTALADHDVHFEQDNIYDQILNYRFPRVDQHGNRNEPVSADVKINNYCPRILFCKILLETSFGQDVDKQHQRGQELLGNSDISIPNDKLGCILMNIHHVFEDPMYSCQQYPKLDQPQSLEVFALLSMLANYSYNTPRDEQRNVTQLESVVGANNIAIVKSLIMIYVVENDSELYQHYDLFIRLAQQTLSRLDFNPLQNPKGEKSTRDLLDEIIGQLAQATKRCAQAIEQNIVDRANQNPPLADANPTIDASRQPSQAHENNYDFIVNRYEAQVINHLSEKYGFKLYNRADAASVYELKEQSVGQYILTVANNLLQSAGQPPLQNLNDINNMLNMLQNSDDNTNSTNRVFKSIANECLREADECLGSGSSNTDLRLCCFAQAMINYINSNSWTARAAMRLISFFADVDPRCIVQDQIKEQIKSITQKYQTALTQRYPDLSADKVKDLVETAVDVDNTYQLLGQPSDNLRQMYNILNYGQERVNLVTTIIKRIDFENREISGETRFQLLNAVFHSEAFNNSVTQLKVVCQFPKAQAPQPSLASERLFNADIFADFVECFEKTDDNQEYLAILPPLGDLFTLLFGPEGPGFKGQTIAFVDLIKKYTPSVLNTKQRVLNFIANYKHTDIKNSETILMLCQQYGELRDFILTDSSVLDNLDQFVAFFDQCSSLPDMVVGRVIQSIHNYLANKDKISDSDMRNAVKIPPVWFTLISEFGQQSLGRTVILPILNTISSDLWRQWFEDPTVPDSIHNPFRVDENNHLLSKLEFDPILQDMLQRLANLRLQEDGGMYPNPADLFSEKCRTHGMTAEEDQLHQLAVQLLQQMYDLAAQACLDRDAAVRQQKQAQLLQYQNALHLIEIIFNDSANLRFDRKQVYAQLQRFHESLLKAENVEKENAEIKKQNRQASDTQAAQNITQNGASTRTPLAIQTETPVPAVTPISDDELHNLLTTGRKTYSEKDIADYETSFTRHNEKCFSVQDLQNLTDEFDQLARQVDTPLNHHVAFAYLFDKDNEFKQQILLGSAALMPTDDDSKLAGMQQQAQQQLEQCALQGLTNAQLVCYAKRLGKAYQEQEENRRGLLNLQPVNSFQLDQINRMKIQFLHELLLVLAESYFRVTGKYPYLHQLMAILLSSQSLLGNKQLFFNLGTGGGKSGITAILVMLDHLIQPDGHVTYVTTANNDLATRDAKEINQYTSFFGSSTQHISGSDKTRPTELPTDCNSIFVSDENNATITVDLLNNAHSASQDQHSITFLKDEVDKGHAQNTKDVLVGHDPAATPANGDRIHNPHEEIYNKILAYFISEQGIERPESLDLDEIINSLRSQLTLEQIKTLQQLSPPDKRHLDFIQASLAQWDEEHPDQTADREQQRLQFQAELEAKSAIAHYVQATKDSINAWTQSPSMRRVKLTIKMIQGKPTVSYLLYDAETNPSPSSVYNKEQHMMFSAMIQRLIHLEKLTENDLASLPSAYRDYKVLKELPVYFGPDLTTLVVGKSSSTLLEAAKWHQDTDQLGTAGLESFQKTNQRYCQVTHNIGFTGTNVNNPEYYRSVDGYLVDVPIFHGGNRIEKEPVCTTTQSIDDIYQVIRRHLRARNAKAELPYFQLESAVKIPWLLDVLRRHDTSKDRDIYVLREDGYWYKVNPLLESQKLSDSQLAEQLAARSAGQDSPILLGTVQNLSTTLSSRLPAITLHTDVDEERRIHHKALVDSVIKGGGNKTIPATGVFHRNASSAHRSGLACMELFAQKSSKPAVIFIKAVGAEEGFERWDLQNGKYQQCPGVIRNNDHTTIVEGLNKKGIKSVTFATLDSGRGTDTAYGKIIKAELIADSESDRQVSGRTARGRNDGLCEELYTVSDLVTTCHLAKNEGIADYAGWSGWSRKTQYLKNAIAVVRNTKTEVKASQLASGTRISQYNKELIDFLDLLTTYLPQNSSRLGTLQTIREAMNVQAQQVSSKDLQPEQELSNLRSTWNALIGRLEEAEICVAQSVSDSDERKLQIAEPFAIQNFADAEGENTEQLAQITALLNNSLDKLRPDNWLGTVNQIKQAQTEPSAVLTTKPDYRLAGQEVLCEHVNDKLLINNVNRNLRDWNDGLLQLIACADSPATQEQIFRKHLLPILNSCNDQEFAQLAMISSARCHDNSTGGKELTDCLVRMGIKPSQNWGQEHANVERVYDMCVVATDKSVHESYESQIQAHKTEGRYPVNNLRVFEQATATLSLECTEFQQTALLHQLKGRVLNEIKNCLGADDDQKPAECEQFLQQYYQQYLRNSASNNNKDITLTLEGDASKTITITKEQHAMHLLHLAYIGQKKPYSNNWFARLLQRIGLWPRESNPTAFEQKLDDVFGSSQREQGPQNNNNQHP